MAMNKLERIEKDIEKTKGKIAELQKQLRELEAAKTEQENLHVREVQHFRDAVYHGISQRDQRVDTPEADTAD